MFRVTNNVFLILSIPCTTSCAVLIHSNFYKYSSTLHLHSCQLYFCLLHYYLLDLLPLHSSTSFLPLPSLFSSISLFQLFPGQSHHLACRAKPPHSAITINFPKRNSQFAASISRVQPRHGHVFSFIRDRPMVRVVSTTISDAPSGLQVIFRACY